MRGLRDKNGYTLVETMIFLAVTGGLIIFAMIYISGQQSKADAAQSIRDFQSRADDLMNDVTGGYFPDTGSFSCQNGGSSITISNTPAEQGTNDDCTFLGKVLSFKTGTRDYQIHSVAGLREKSQGIPAQNFADAHPKSIEQIRASDHFQSVLEVTDIQAVLGATNESIRAFGFFAPFPKSASAGLISNTSSLVLVPINGPTLATAAADESDVDTAVDNLTTYGDIYAVAVDKVIVCVQYGGAGGLRGALVFGSNDNKLTSELHIGDIDTYVPGVAGGYTCP